MTFIEKSYTGYCSALYEQSCLKFIFLIKNYVGGGGRDNKNSMGARG